MLNWKRIGTKEYPPHRLSYIGLYQPAGLRLVAESGLIFIKMLYIMVVILQVYSVVTVLFVDFKPMMMAGEPMTEEQI